MAERYDVAIKVVSQKGTCASKHKVGDEWVMKTEGTPSGICHSAYNALFPFSQVLMYSGVLPWESDPDATTVACPDAQNPVVFELRRLRK